MSIADEKPYVSPARLIEKIQTTEVEKNPVSFTWPRVKEGCKRVEHITLGATAKDNYALLVYQEPLPKQFPQEFVGRLETYVDEQGQVFKYIQEGKTPSHISMAEVCTYLAEIEDYPPTQKTQPVETIRQETEKQPEQISTEQLLENLKGKVCLIYTGAGISVERGLPNAAQLKQQIGVDIKNDIDDFVLSMCNPDKQQTTITKMHKLQQVFYGKPTRAHYLLAEIQTLTEGNIAIATENLDKLHEETGGPVVPLGRIDDIPQEYLQNVDVVVTIGLKQNFTDLIPRYKTENPTGKVVAVNVTPPPYSYPVDAYVLCEAQGFCQKLRNSVEKEID